MRRVFGLLGIGTLLSSAAVFGLLPTSVASAVSVRAVAVGTASVDAPTLPNVNIKPAPSGGAKYKPNSVSVTWSGPSSSNEVCNSSDYSFTFTNKTTRLQKVSYDSSVIGKIPAGQTVGACTFGSGSTTLELGLRGSPSAVLTVTVS